MPSERFYRLSEEKRKTICEAAIREFARVTMDKVSINQIIKNADISRGSFYTYFEDKWDIVSYIFEDIQEKLIILVKDRARKTGGDIFAVMDCIMQEMLQFCCSRPNFDFLKIIMLHMNSDDMFGGRLSKKKNEEYAKTGEQVERWLYEHADQAKTHFTKFEDFHCLFTLGMASVAMAIREIYDGVPLEDARRNYSQRMEILKYGSMRRDVQENPSLRMQNHT